MQTHTNLISKKILKSPKYINYNQKMNKYIKLIISFSAITTFYLSWNINKEYLTFLPLSVLIATFVFDKVFNRLSKSTVFTVFTIQIYFRYCLLPILESYGQNLNIGDKSNYVYIALAVMIIELYACLFIFKLHINIQTRILFLNDKSRLTTLRNKLFVTIFLITSLGVIYSTNTLENVNFIWNLDSYVDKYIKEELTEISNMGGVLFNVFKVILALFIIGLIYNSNTLNAKAKNYMYLGVILISCIFVIGISRLGLIWFALPLVLLVKTIVNNKFSNKIVAISFVALLLSLATSSYFKFSRFDDIATFDTLISASSINAYFAGHGNIATGFEAYSKIEASDAPLYLINDTFQNIPIISKLTSSNFKLTYTFNEHIYMHREYADQIVPLSISGLFHFGLLGLFLYSSAFISFAMYLERMSYRTTYIGYKYIFISTSITFSLIFMLNLGSFYSILTQTFIFLFIPLYLFKKIK